MSGLQYGWLTEIWYPAARDLKLPQVPVQERARIRKRIAPWLQKLRRHDFGVEAGDCFAVSQAFVLTANDPGVTYVEGAWIRTPWNKEDQPEPHGWVLVDGWPIDLMAELYSREDEPWEYLYEPCDEFSCAELQSKFVSKPSYSKIIATFRDSGSVPIGRYPRSAMDRLIQRMKQQCPDDHRSQNTPMRGAEIN